MTTSQDEVICSATYTRRRAIGHATIGASVIMGYLSEAMAAPTAAPDLDLGALHGRVVYLDFWASWCAPCQASFPFMSDLRSRYSAADFALIAVNVDKERAKADAFLQRVHATFPILYDPSGALAARFKIPTMPTSLLIDRAGQTRFVHAGFRPEKQNEYAKDVEELLHEKR